MLMMIFQVYYTKLFIIKLLIRKTIRNASQNKTIISSQSYFFPFMAPQT